MQVIDRDIHLAKALIIDGNPTSRSVLAGQLRDLGVLQVRQMSRVQDARLALEESAYDIVMCEMTFNGAPMSGQDLLDELRREQLLPYYTVFILVTGEATYSQVLEAAEATVDGYLVKPYSGVVLGEKLSEVRRRKRALKPIYEAIQAQELARAAALAEVRFNARESYWTFSAQVAAELWLRADQPAQAMKIYNTVVAEKPQAWAKAGIARARLAMGELAAARRLLEALVQESPDYADAQDLLGRLLVEQGEFAPALDAFRLASSLTPGCLLRMQHRGTLAFYQGHKAEAAQHLDRTIALGRKSKLFDGLCLFLLGLLKFDQRDSRGMGGVIDQMVQMSDSFGSSVRLARMRQALSGLGAIQAHRPDDSLRIARKLAADVMTPDFDLEAAAVTIGLWARLPTGEVPLKEFDTLLRLASLRFCVSKASTEVLVASTDKIATAEETVRNSHADIMTVAEQALNKSMSGEAPAAVAILLEQGERTRNAKLIDMAGAVARRHAKTVPDVEAVQARVQSLQDAYCAPLTHLAGMRRSARMPGGVVLRT
jgi:DNA-binding NarL/FixJ family response regulator